MQLCRLLLLAASVCATLAVEEGEALPPAAAVPEGLICQLGCWDNEDEACHEGLTEMQCAEIYGHVEWSQKCNCKDSSGQLLVSEAAEPETSEAKTYFSVPAFIVLFRESLEVVIVLVIMVQFLTKMEAEGLISKDSLHRFRREIYIGASAGFLVCLLLGVGLLALASLLHKAFTGSGRQIFEGCVMLLTSAVLSFLAINFYKMLHTKEAHERKMRALVLRTAEQCAQCGEEAVAPESEGNGADPGNQGNQANQGHAAFGRKHAFLVLSFTTGLREGMESIIFLVGVVSDVRDLSALPIPIITALVLARLIGCCFFQSTRRMRIEWFVRVSAVLLLFVAAGFFSSSMHHFQELEVFGEWSPRSRRRWQNLPVWDARACCDDKANRFFVFMRALFGWQDQATPIELFAYGTYWIITLTAGFFMIRRARRQLDSLLARWRLEDEAAEKEKAALDCEVGEGAGEDAVFPEAPKGPRSSKEGKLQEDAAASEQRV